MKKIILYILGIIGICFLIPIIFTVKFKVQEVSKVQDVPELEVEKYSYSDFGTIKLLHQLHLYPRKHFLMERIFFHICGTLLWNIIQSCALHSKFRGEKICKYLIGSNDMGVAFFRVS